MGKSKRFDGELPFKVAYKKVACESLQHDNDDKSVSLHTDITLLQRVDRMRVSQQIVDIVKSRFQQVPETVAADVQSEMDKLSDFDRDKLTPSRYIQSLNDRKEYLSKLMSSVDESVKKLKEEADKQKVTSYRKSLQELFDSL